ncbi:hypothetical protein NKJ59_07600 [Mesorhizobium australicum]|uniref:hypothetical protein n=1 Tax=Mesorhizobium australicum TaxID=536018 RepID=UPI003335A9CF
MREPYRIGKLEIPPLDDAKVRKLLQLAGIDPLDKKAAGKLEFSHQAACIAAHREAIHRPIPSEYNPPLDLVRTLADELLAALANLDLHPHAKLALWLDDGWSAPLFISTGDRDVRDNARAGITTVLRRLSKSAIEARYSRDGQPPSQLKNAVVTCAFDFFARNSTKKPTTTATGQFGKFAAEFYGCVTDEWPSEDGQTLAGIVRDVVKRSRDRDCTSEFPPPRPAK